MSLPQNSAPVLKRDDLDSLVAFALEETRRLGASDAEVGISIDTGLSVTARLGDVETLEYQRDRDETCFVVNRPQRWSKT